MEGTVLTSPNSDTPDIANFLPDTPRSRNWVASGRVHRTLWAMRSMRWRFWREVPAHGVPFSVTPQTVWDKAVLRDQQAAWCAMLMESHSWLSICADVLSQTQEQKPLKILCSGGLVLMSLPSWPCHGMAWQWLVSGWAFKQTGEGKLHSIHTASY